VSGKRHFRESCLGGGREYQKGNAAYEERKSPLGRPGEVKAPAGGKSRHPGAAGKSV